MVPRFSGASVRRTDDVSSRVEPFDVSDRRKASAIDVQRPTPGRLEIVRRQLCSKGFSSSVVSILVAGN